MHHCHPFAVLLPSSMVAYRAVCPTGDARQGDLAGSGGGSFLQGNRHAWPLMKRLADDGQRWPTLVTAGPKGTHQLMLVSGVATQSLPIPAIPSMDLPSSSMRTRTLGSTAGEIRPDERKPRSVAMFGRQGATTGWIEWMERGGGGGWVSGRNMGRAVETCQQSPPSSTAGVVKTGLQQCTPLKRAELHAVFVAGGVIWPSMRVDGMMASRGIKTRRRSGGSAGHRTSALPRGNGGARGAAQPRRGLGAPRFFWRRSSSSQVHVPSTDGIDSNTRPDTQHALSSWTRHHCTSSTVLPHRIHRAPMSVLHTRLARHTVLFCAPTIDSPGVLPTPPSDGVD